LPLAPSARKLRFVKGYLNFICTAGPETVLLFFDNGSDFDNRSIFQFWKLTNKIQIYSVKLHQGWKRLSILFSIPEHQVLINDYKVELFVLVIIAKNSGKLK
jgi:hypothetical protein